MSAISNSHPPDIPPPAPNLEPNQVILPAPRASSPPLVAADTGPIRKDDTKTPCFNPITKAQRTYGCNKKATSTSNVTRSDVSAPRSSPDTFAVDMPLPGETTQSTPDLNITFIPQINRIPYHKFIPGKGLMPNRMMTPVMLDTNTPEHDQLVYTMSEPNYAAANLAAKLEYEALKKFSAPQDEVLLKDGITLKTIIGVPAKRILEMLASRRKYTHKPLSGEEQAVYYDLLCITDELHHAIDATIENMATLPQSPTTTEMSIPDDTEIPSSVKGKDNTLENQAQQSPESQTECRPGSWTGTEAWSASPTPVPAPNPFQPGLTLDKIIHTQPDAATRTILSNTKEEQLLNSVKFMFFVAHNRFLSTEECQDILACFNPNVFGKWVRLSDEDMLPPSPTANSVKSNKTIRAEPAKPAETTPATAPVPSPAPTPAPSFTPGQPKKKEKKFKKLTDFPVPTPPTPAPAPAEMFDAEKAAAVEKACAALADKHKTRLEAPGAPKISAQAAPAVKNTQTSAVPAVTKEGVAKAFAANPPKQVQKLFAGAVATAQAPKPVVNTNTSAPQKFKGFKAIKSTDEPAPPKGPRYLIKCTPAIPKEWFNHNTNMRVLNRIKEYFEKAKKTYGKRLYPRCLAVGFTPAGHVSVDFSPKTLESDVKHFQEGMLRKTQIPGLKVMTRNTKWTKIVISHVPTHLYLPEIDMFAPEIAVGQELKLIMLDNIPQEFLDKYPMPTHPKWLLHPNHLKKTNANFRKAILIVKDPEKTTFEDLNRLGVGFGVRNAPSTLSRYNEKPQLSECFQCCSYECSNPRACRNQIKCGICGKTHATNTHVDKCSACKQEGRTNQIDGRACEHPAKCPACKGGHEFGDHRCIKRKGYRENIRSKLMRNKIDNDAPPSEGGDADHPMIVDNAEPQAGLITQTSDSNKDAASGSFTDPIVFNA